MGGPLVVSTSKVGYCDAMMSKAHIQGSSCTEVFLTSIGGIDARYMSRSKQVLLFVFYRVDAQHNKLLTGSNDKSIALWDTRRMKERVATYSHHKGAVFCLQAD